MRLLESLGYSLYASLGTADFYTEHGVKVQGRRDLPHAALPSRMLKHRRVLSLSLFLCFYCHCTNHVQSM